ncbi:MAG: beta-RFAP synthase [Planctomycetota bacterium]|jgi:beta-RFAP synthase|nr:beta-RFAP synthase [Planctomycetota bacterium]
MTIQIEAPSRLHFGLLARNPELPRQFGGVGVMIREPGSLLRVEPASEFSVSGQLSQRVQGFAQCYCNATGMSLPQAKLILEHSAPEHSGFGTGTQVGLLIAKALSLLSSDKHVTGPELAERIGRGGRSGIGLHGFEHGGLLVDGGKSRHDKVAPLVARHPVPEEWRFVVVIPEALQGLHGGAEEQAMRELAIPVSGTEKLSRIVLMGILPTIAKQDFQGFSEAIYEFNYEAGLCFKAAQGGVYAGPLLADIVEYIRSSGFPGAGQSSWGPAVFGLVPDAASASRLLVQISERFGFNDSEILVTQADNQGATFEI